MKLAIAQMRSMKGDIAANIDKHVTFTYQAIQEKADLIVFPELSLTAYEPELAGQLAIDINDDRLQTLQNQANKGNITICAGVPLKHKTGIVIGMIIFQPQQERKLYSKKYLHEDEYPFFVAGEGGSVIIKESDCIGFAICYEIFIQEHAADAAHKGASIYVASVAKSATGVQRAQKTLQNNSREYALVTLMANAVGYTDNFESAGTSSIWNNKGELIGQLDNISEGLLVADITNNKITTLII